MILLLGSTGYVGGAFADFFEQNEIRYLGISRCQVDYTKRDRLIELIAESKPSFLINAAGYTGKPNVDACEIHKSECLAGNAVLPGTIRAACEHHRLSWGHVSSGCIYAGCKPDGSGFSEQDQPNFTFRTNHCSFYSGCKALGEECLEGAGDIYIWRPRIPFNSQASPRNYLEKLLRYPTLLEATNSITHLDEFVRAAWQCWDRDVEPGIYNMTNPGSITTGGVVELIRKYLNPEKEFRFFSSESEFMDRAAKAPRSNCVLDSSKLAGTGIRLTPAWTALERSLRNWQTEGF